MSQPYHKQKNQRTALEIIFLGIFKGLWWLIKLPFGKNRKKQPNIDRVYVSSKKSEISMLLNSDNHIELKHAVLEADKLVDYMLQARGYKGETFADRLRSAQSFIDAGTYEMLWQGHKVRNQIAHDDTGFSNEELKSAARKLLKYVG